MWNQLLGVGRILLVAVPHAFGEVSPPDAVLSIGDRVRTEIGGQYRAESLFVGEGRVEVSGEVVRRDWLTLTVASLDGRETRYPAVGTRLAGRITALDADGLTLDLGDGKPQVRVPRPAIRGLDVSHVTRTRAAEGAWFGALPLGLLGFLTVGLATGDPGPLCLGTATGVAVGAGLGALVGSMVKTERWERVSVGMSVGPRPGRGMGAALCLRF
jgi:hypothetical protein